ncbi:MAG: protein kinase domain-containing protein [Planctomycetota bacterium]|jgi:hypothetical protein
MPKQADIEFANQAVRLGFAPKETVAECMEMLDKLDELGMDDTLEGIMRLWGHITEEQSEEVRKQLEEERSEDEEEDEFRAEVDQEEEEDEGEEEEEEEEEEEAAPPASEETAEKPPTPPPSTPHSELPKLPGFELELKIEKDGSGINYLGRNVQGERKAIIHLLYPQTAEDKRVMNWLIKHGRQIERINHPAVARFFAVRTLVNNAYFAQEIPNGTVLDLALKKGTFEERQALGVLRNVVSVLKAAETLEVFHGRLGPSNFFLTDNGGVEVRLFTYLDRERTLFLDEPDPEDQPFIDPEILAGKPPTMQSEMYSLGKVLLKMVGADGDPSEQLDEKCASIASRLTATESSDRYPNYEALLTDL